jgi:hypothetical protein
MGGDSAAAERLRYESPPGYPRGRATEQSAPDAGARIRPADGDRRIGERRSMTSEYWSSRAALRLASQSRSLVRDMRGSAGEASGLRLE